MLKQPKELKRPATQTSVFTRHVSLTRNGKARWGLRYRQWKDSKDTVGNIRAAIRYANRHLDTTGEGTIVYTVGAGFRELTPIYEAKMGNGNRPYKSWKKRSQIAAYWERLVG